MYIAKIQKETKKTQSLIKNRLTSSTRSSEAAAADDASVKLLQRSAGLLAAAQRGLVGQQPGPQPVAAAGGQGGGADSLAGSLPAQPEPAEGVDAAQL